MTQMTYYRYTCRVERKTLLLVLTQHRRSQDILWGALFFPEKVTDFF